MSGLAVEPIDDLAHFEGEFNASVNAVQSRSDYPAAGEIAIVEGANPLDAKGFGRRIELPEQIVDDLDEFVAGQFGGDLIEPNDVGEDDGDVLMFLRDGLLHPRDIVAQPTRA